jgi:glyoxylase-like metal-dependent hydrolase (beta-lactamase superfamily II)
MQITEHIHALKLPFQIPAGPGITIERFVNVYLVYSDSGIHLIDSGVAGCENNIYAYIRSTGHTPEEIATLILTHSHPDHIGAARAVKDAAGCAVWAHPAERDWIEDTEKQVRERPVPGFTALVGGPVAVDRLLEDGETLELSGVAVDVLHAPGHSRGSISLLVREDGALITGDAIPVPGDIPIYEDVAATVRTVRRLRETPGMEVLLSSWDIPRRGGDADLFMGESLSWLERIHRAVSDTAEGGTVADSPEFVRGVLAKLGLPVQAANPLVARTFAAHLQTSVPSPPWR